MAKYFFIEVPTPPDINTTYVADVVDTGADSEFPAKLFDALCEAYPGKTFYAAKAELYGTAVVKATVVKTGCSGVNSVKD